MMTEKKRQNKKIHAEIVATLASESLRFLHIFLKALPILYIADYYSFVQRYHSFVHAFYYLFRVGNHYYRSPVTVDILKKLHDVPRCCFIEVSCRFIAEKDQRSVDDGTGDCHALFSPPESWLG